MSDFIQSDVTIVIVTFKSELIVENCLKTIDPKIPVIIVENSGNNLFKNHIEKKYSNVRCILSNSNIGFGSANNIGIENVKSRLVFILSPDAKLYPDTIEKLIFSANKIKNFAILAPLNQEDLQLMNLTGNEIKPILSQKLKGYAMFLNLSEIRETGYFDENIFLYYEELDLCTRLVKNNKKIYLIPSSRIDHLGGKSHNPEVAHQVELSRNWHIMWSSFYYKMKTYGYTYALLTHFFKLISYSTKVVFLMIFFKKKQCEIYKHRLSGLINSMIKKKSWYRPKI